jgi:hypothetical protein
MSHELTMVYEAKELAPAATRGQRSESGITQREAVWEVLDLFGPDLELPDLRALASQTYGRLITLGITLRCKLEWGQDKLRKAA